MKKIVMIFVLCGLAFYGFPMVPGYSGARSLSLGYASTAFNYDINSIFINPAILTSVNYSLSGYQYQSSCMDYKNFQEDLSDILEYNLIDFENINTEDKTVLFSKLEDLFQSKFGMYGFLSNVPGYISRGYGISVSFINTAVVNPVIPGEDSIFNKEASEITNADIAALKMNFLGLKYKQISLSYAMKVHSSIHMGISLHYLDGKITEFTGSLLDDIFTPGAEAKEYLEHGWENAGDKFSKFIADLGFNVDLGRYFKAGLMMKNIGAAKIETPLRKITFPKRITAGLAFRPNAGWGIYLDMDLKKLDLLYNGQDMQPISFGIEKGFFKNKFFVRVGMLSDLAEKYFIGKKSNALYGLGVGFNMRKIIVDLAVGLDNDGTIKNLAVSGFIIVK
jgi:hypothetical protein